MTELYMSHLLTRRIKLPFNLIGENIKENLNQVLNELSGKCAKEGYIKYNSINILTHSSGIINDNNVIFDVVFEAQVCHPVEGMKLKCIVKNTTKAGIRAEINEEISPIVIFVARDHYYEDDYFSSRKEGDIITINIFLVA